MAMSWYYADNGQQAGPIDDAQLEELARSGKILFNTLVWREGMAEWQPYGQVRMTSKAGGPPGLPAAAATVVLGANEAACAECGRVADKQDMLAYSGIFVCANCKPVFLQKLSEGASIETGVRRYAGFWIRGGAKFIDGLIVRVVGFPVGFLMGLSAPSRSAEAAVLVQVLAGLFGLLINMAFVVFFLGKFGATPGKMACKLKVVMADGRPISYGRAFGRFWAEILSACFTLGIGYIMAGFDDEKRALHDRICDTRVIYK